MSVVALVAAKDAANSIGPTVATLAALAGVDEVWVVDDGSNDDTAAVARAAGARVVRLDENRGKGGALVAGLAATPHATRYLLADADLRETAAGLQPLLDPRGELVVGVLPSAEGRGGFGSVVRLARAGVARACGFVPRAPLSGQRVVDGPTLRALTLAPRFGVEVGMTIDVVRSGGAVREMDVAVDHDHRGRSIGGFRHRGRQGVDVVGALLPRLTTTRQRAVSVVAAGLVAFVVLSTLSVAARPSRGAALPTVGKVVLVAYDHLALSDLDRSDLPALRGLAREGVAGALNVRTTDRRSLSQRGRDERPSARDALASLGASARVRAPAGLGAVSVEGDGFADPLTVRGAAAARALARRDHTAGLPGALGDALRTAGKRTGVVALRDDLSAAIAVMDRQGEVDVTDPAISVAMEASDVLIVDGGEDQADCDQVLRAVLELADPDTAVIVFSPTPKGDDWSFTPVLLRAGTANGAIASASTRRADLGVLADLAPTTLALLGIDPPAEMTGAALRVTGHAPDFPALERFDQDGQVRLRFFLPAAVGYTVAGVAFYLLVVAALVANAGARLRRALRTGSLVAAAFPLAVLLNGATQHWLSFGGESPLFVAALCVVLGALAARLRGIRGLYVLAAASVAVIALDVAVTGPIHASTILGYSLETTGRFYGLPNASFAVFAPGLFLVAAWVAGSTARPTMVRAVAGATVLTVGVGFVAAPWLGNDVGGFVALLPVVAVTSWSLFGRRLTALRVGAAAAGSAVLVIAIAALAAVLGEGSHLGRTAAQGAADNATLVTTLTRRIDANVGLLIDQWWGFPTFALALAGAWVLARNWWPEVFPADSAIRRSGVAICAVSLAGFAVNDSGPVVTVLCLVVLAPVLSVLALGARGGRGATP